MGVEDILKEHGFNFSASCGGKFSAFKSGMELGITRMTMAQLPRWVKIFTRKRQSLATA